MAHFRLTAIQPKSNKITFRESSSISISNLLCDLAQLFGSVSTERGEPDCRWSTEFEQPHCSSPPQILKPKQALHHYYQVFILIAYIIICLRGPKNVTTSFF